MRLWTVHPQYLDAQGLVAAWREALLAQKVLDGKTRGYRNHPQLSRFRAHSQPGKAIASFLTGLAHEATRRGYRFDSSKILHRPLKTRMSETRGQLLYEWKHLRAKLRRRSPQIYLEICTLKTPKPHPLFRIIPGPVRDWERT